MARGSGSRRFGLELELLAPEGRTRDDLARAVAEAFSGELQFGFKYHGQGFLPDGRPDCHLSPASRVLVHGAWFASFVDDPTVSDDLSPTTATMGLARTDDVRMAAWVERNAWSKASALQHRLGPLLQAFSGRLDEHGLVDPWGLPLVRWHRHSAQRARACEVVLRPLLPAERPRVLRRLLQLAASLGFTVPAEAALHVHADAAPFRSTTALRRLILRWAEGRARWLAKLQPNPRCRKLGPFAPTMVRVAREAPDDLPFEAFAAALHLAGAVREVDVNLLGVIDRYPKQPTVEVRCLPMSLDPEALVARLAQVDALLDEWSAPATTERRAQARRRRRS